MPDIQDRLREAVFAAIDELNEQRAIGQRLTKTLDTVLAGQDGPLDSLGFVNLVVALEQHLDGVFAEPVSLLDDERLDVSSAHFQTVGSLVSYLAHLHAEQT